MKILLTAHRFFPQYAAGTETLTYSVAVELIASGYGSLTGVLKDDQ